MERDLGITPPATPAFRPNAEDDAARAERLRLARQARQARESGVFFQISARDQTGKASTQPPAGQAASSSAAVAMAQPDARRPQLDHKRDQHYPGHKPDFLQHKIAHYAYTPPPPQHPATPF